MTDRKEFIDSTVLEMKKRLEKELIKKNLLMVSAYTLRLFIGKPINKRMATAIDKALTDAKMASDDCEDFNKPHTIWRDPGNEWLDVTILLYFQQHGIGYQDSPTIYLGKRGEIFTEEHCSKVSSHYQDHSDYCAKIVQLIESAEETLGNLWDAKEAVQTAQEKLDSQIESLENASYFVRTCAGWVK